MPQLYDNVIGKGLPVPDCARAAMKRLIDSGRLPYCAVAGLNEVNGCMGVGPRGADVPAGR